MEGVEHRTVKANGVDIHVAIKGPVDGPVVLLLHGFPEFWYSWRHQISYLADLGYRAVAPDLRGYGDSYSPPEISSYTCIDIVGDLVGVIDAVVADDRKKVFVVGHDWGAMVAWYLCLFRPEKVKALVALSVPFSARPLDTSKKPTELLRAFYGNNYYICRFQEPGDIEAEMATVGTERVMKRFLTYHSSEPYIMPKDKTFWGPLDQPIPLPPWLSEKEVQCYVNKFHQTGFTGGVNFYRNYDRNYELLRPWWGAKVQVPAKFITGDEDVVYAMPGVKEYIHSDKFKEDVPLLELPPVVLNGVAHYLHQEKANEISNYIYEFIKKF